MFTAFRTQWFGKERWAFMAQSELIIALDAKVSLFARPGVTEFMRCRRTATRTADLSHG